MSSDLDNNSDIPNFHIALYWLRWSSTTLLSIQPHQEPRFLIPLIVPMITFVVNNGRILRAGRLFWVNSPLRIHTAGLKLLLRRSLGSSSTLHLPYSLVYCIRGALYPRFSEYMTSYTTLPARPQKVFMSYTGRHICHLDISSLYPQKVRCICYTSSLLSHLNLSRQM